MASREKKHDLSNIDLARAATAPEEKHRGIIKASAFGDPYSYYRAFKAHLPSILDLPVGPFGLKSKVTKRQLSRMIGLSCSKDKKEKRANRYLANALRDFIRKHKARSAEFIHDPVPLDRAGDRRFWIDYILQINGKRYIVFIDPRLDKGLDELARKFVFSILNTYIRLLDLEHFGDVEFLILQFEKPAKGKRRVLAHYDDETAYMDDKEIGQRIDAVYRILDEIEIERAA